jgi:acetolactate synthase-1/2/3 large subunit
MKVSDLVVKCLEPRAPATSSGCLAKRPKTCSFRLRLLRSHSCPADMRRVRAFIADVWGRFTGEAGVCPSTLGPGAHQPYDGRRRCKPRQGSAGGHHGARRARPPPPREPSAPRYRADVRARSPSATARSTIRVSYRKSSATRSSSPNSRSPVPRTSSSPRTLPDWTYPTACSRCHGVPCPVLSPTTERWRRPSRWCARRSGHWSSLAMARSGNARATSSAGLPTARVSPSSRPSWAKARSRTVRRSRSSGTGFRDYVRRAHLVLTVGYDIAEYAPDRWNPKADKTIVHIDVAPAEVYGRYPASVEVVADIAATIRALNAGLSAAPARFEQGWYAPTRQLIVDDIASYQLRAMPFTVPGALDIIRRALPTMGCA